MENLFDYENVFLLILGKGFLQGYVLVMFFVCKRWDRYMVNIL